MNTELTIRQLAALAQETRLQIFRALVVAGFEGLNPGKLIEQLNISKATLSFHLKELKSAELVTARQDGRFLFYSANFSAMNQLVTTLTENCCSQTNQSC